jgi:hypothetical protein
MFRIYYILYSLPCALLHMRDGSYICLSGAESPLTRVACGQMTPVQAAFWIVLPSG